VNRLKSGEREKELPGEFTYTAFSFQTLSFQFGEQQEKKNEAIPLFRGIMDACSIRNGS
jgi:hypothetical protein